MRYQTHRHVDRSREQVFDVIATNVQVNHPKWESEVLEIRPLTPGPVRVGTRAIMVRKDFGRVSETEYEVTSFRAPEVVAFRHPTSAMSFELAFELKPAGDGTDITASVDMQPHGFMRVMWPLLRLRLPRTSERLMTEMVRVVEAQTTPVG